MAEEVAVLLNSLAHWRILSGLRGLELWGSGSRIPKWSTSCTQEPQNHSTTGIKGSLRDQRDVLVLGVYRITRYEELNETEENSIF